MNLEDFDKGMISTEKSEEKAFYDKTWKERQQELFNSIQKMLDWNKLPLDILFYAILLVGAVLMYLSIYDFTHNSFVAILSISFSEGGIAAWKMGVERKKNTEKQLEIAKWMRNYHIFVSVILLISNMLLESIDSISQEFGIRIDGAVWIVFGLIALTAMLDLWNYISFLDNDRELIAKRKHESEVAKLNAYTREKRMEALRHAEEISTNAMVEFYNENAPRLAMIKGRVEAAKEIKTVYENMGITPEEVDKLIELAQSIGKKEVSSEEEKQKIDTDSPKPRQYIKSGRFKKINPIPPIVKENLETNQTSQLETKAIE